MQKQCIIYSVDSSHDSFISIYLFNDKVGYESLNTEET